VTIFNSASRAGGGSLPLSELPTKCIGIQISKMNAGIIEKTMRANDPPIIGRIEDDIDLMFIGSPAENAAIARKIRQYVASNTEARVFELGKYWPLRFIMPEP